MKTHKHLYEQICSFENLLAAAEQALRGKRRQPQPCRFAFHLERELVRLQEALQTQTYVPGDYRQFLIHDPKERLISAAPFRDRVVHHAFCRVVEPLFERGFIFDSYACRPGKGQHAAADRFQSFCQPGRYVLKCDLARYFPSIDHEILLGRLARQIGCDRTLGLAERILVGGPPQEELRWYFPGDDLFTPDERRRGLPIGNLTSQFFANVYLDGFDHFVKETLRCRWYVRYVDDFVVLDDDKARLWEVLAAMEEHLATLRLRLHPRKCRVFPVEVGTDFLGYVIWPTRRRLRRGNAWRFTRRLRRQLRAVASGEMSREAVQASVNSWLGHARHADTYRLRVAIFNRELSRRR